LFVGVAEVVDGHAESVVQPVSVVASCADCSCEQLAVGVGVHQIGALVVVEQVSDGAAQTEARLHVVGVAGRTQGNTDSVGSEVVVWQAEGADGSGEGQAVRIEVNDSDA